MIGARLILSVPNLAQKILWTDLGRHRVSGRSPSLQNLARRQRGHGNLTPESIVQTGARLSVIAQPMPSRLAPHSRSERVGPILARTVRDGVDERGASTMSISCAGHSTRRRAQRAVISNRRISSGALCNAPLGHGFLFVDRSSYRFTCRPRRCVDPPKAQVQG